MWSASGQQYGAFSLCKHTPELACTSRSLVAGGGSLGIVDCTQEESYAQNHTPHPDYRSGHAAYRSVGVGRRQTAPLTSPVFICLYMQENARRFAICGKRRVAS